MDLQKCFLQVSSVTTQKSCDQDRVISFDTPETVFVSNLFLLKFLVCEHRMSYALEMNINDGFKSEHVRSCSLTTKKYISIATISLTTKPGRMVTYHESVLPIKPRDTLIKWSFQITKTIISLLSQKLAGLCFTLRDNYLWSIMNLWSLIPEKLRDKLEQFYLHYRSA